MDEYGDSPAYISDGVEKRRGRHLIQVLIDINIMQNDMKSLVISHAILVKLHSHDIMLPDVIDLKKSMHMDARTGEEWVVEEWVM
jgi:hypothetical protein